MVCITLEMVPETKMPLSHLCCPVHGSRGELGGLRRIFSFRMPGQTLGSPGTMSFGSTQIQHWCLTFFFLFLKKILPVI